MLLLQMPSSCYCLICSDLCYQALELNASENEADESAIQNQLIRVNNAKVKEEKALKRKLTQMGLYLTSGFDDDLFKLTDGENEKPASAEAEASPAAEPETRSRVPLWDFEPNDFKAMDKQLNKEWEDRVGDLPKDKHEPIKLIKLNAAFAALGEEVDDDDY